jgi:hypothetical protein
MSAVLSDKAVDSEIADDWAKIQEKYTPEELEAPEVITEAITEEKEEVIPVSREADGKFKAREDKGEKKEAPKDAKPDKGVTDKQKPVTETDSIKPAKVEATESPIVETPARDVERPPSSWKPLVRAEWAKLPPNVRAEIHRREQDFQNGQSQLLPDAQLGKSLRDVIKPYEAMIQAEGGTPERAVADLFRTAAVFRTGTQMQKLQAIAQVADQFRVDLTPLFNAMQQRQPQVANGNTPQAGQVRDPRVDQLIEQNQRQERERQQQQQQEQQRVSQELESSVNRWMNETDAQGNPKRPYLNDVINEMSALMAQFKQSDPSLNHSQALDKAYEAAIWAHPEVRQLLTQQQQTELEAKRRAENQTRVRDAKRAGSVNVTRRASTPSPGKPGSMDETLSATARELGLIT